MLAKTTDGKTQDLPLLQLTKDNYLCPEGEERVYHCRIEVKKFDGDTGERLSRPKLCKFEPKFFEAFGLHNLRQQGYTVDVLHNPSEWEKAHAAELAEQEQAKARQAAEKAAADREAMKAEILAELKAAGVIPAENKSKTTTNTKK